MEVKSENRIYAQVMRRMQILKDEEKESKVYLFIYLLIYYVFIFL